MTITEYYPSIFDDSVLAIDYIPLIKKKKKTPEGYVRKAAFMASRGGGCDTPSLPISFCKFEFLDTRVGRFGKKIR